MPAQADRMAVPRVRLAAVLPLDRLFAAAHVTFWLTLLGLVLAPLATGAGPKPGGLDTTFGALVVSVLVLIAPGSASPSTPGTPTGARGDMRPPEAALAGNSTSADGDSFGGLLPGAVVRFKARRSHSDGAMTNTSLVLL
jgi:hypothetical protein